MNVYFHGEVCVFQTNLKRPLDAKKVKAKGGRYIVANSETTGNHHILEAQDGLEVYEKNGVLYMSTREDARLSCVLKERHDTEVLPAGDYFIKPAQEYDHLLQSTRAVAD